MLNNNHRITPFNESVQHINQSFHIGKVQTRCRFIQKVKRFTGGTLGKLGSQLNPLCFASAQSGTGLSQTDVTKPYFLEGE